MKEFEKWIQSLEYCTGPDWYKQRKMGWKAALEWVLSWETDQESREIIEKEINGTS